MRLSEWWYWFRCRVLHWHDWITVYDHDAFMTCRNCARMSDQ